MTTLFARKALLPDGWADDVRIGIVDGRIASVATDQPMSDGGSDADTVFGYLIPGLCNAHSHAFQRALAGHTEWRSPEGHDDFWSWRQRMYALAGRVDPGTLTAIAQQAYSEMLASGYTSVVEFHYLHRQGLRGQDLHGRSLRGQPGGDASDDRMFHAIRQAAEASGIRLLYLPVMYERAGFQSDAPKREQQPFIHGLDGFLQHRERAAEYVDGRLDVGIGVHSLRAVRPESLKTIATYANDHDIPMHLHIAEQQGEVEQCIAASGRRPVRHLLETVDVGRNWCLVHATHMDEGEVSDLAVTGATVCLCPSTEANLGDGLFPVTDFLDHGGSIAIGSDSHITINPFEELRWLEYGQRLVLQSRNVVSLRDVHVGRELFERALEGGALASGRMAAGLRTGALADIVALRDDDPMFAGHGDESRLDALVFSGYRLPIDRVMVHGDWCVIDGEPTDGENTRSAYISALHRLGDGSLRDKS